MRTLYILTGLSLNKRAGFSVKYKDGNLVTHEELPFGDYGNSNNETLFPAAMYSENDIFASDDYTKVRDYQDNRTGGYTRIRRIDFEDNIILTE